MNEIKERFIQAYQNALTGEPERQQYKLSESELQKLLRLADVHSVYPMIVNTVYSDKTLKKHIQEAIDRTCRQAEQSAQFLSLYRFLTRRGKRPAVLGGMICRRLYPEPEQLTSDGEDLLISADQYDQYCEMLMDYGMKPDGSNRTYSGKQLRVTLHTDPFSEDFRTFNKIFTDIDKKTVIEEISGIPVSTPGYTDHLMYLICTAFTAFVDGNIGIRQVSDILLFSMKYIDNIAWEMILSSCRDIHIYDFVSAVYRIGEKYLFSDKYPERLKELWQTGTDEQDLLDDILTGDDQQLHSDNLKRYAEEYLKICGIELSSFVRQNKSAGSQKKETCTGSKEKRPGILNQIHKWIRQSFLTAVLSPLYMIISRIEYHILNLIGVLKGDRMPTESERAEVRENVTFIIKSFERQNLVKELCRNIEHMYPGTAVIVADDSSTPLTVDQDNVKVIHLPFNSGLSAGLKAALEEVRTPYVMRMDDDELLMVRSKVHRELQYLMAHPELDLIGFGHTTAIRCRSPKRNFEEYRKCPMDDAPLSLRISHMTRIDDNHTVLGKVANIYLARTEKLREVGFDPNIRVIDHHDFFWRAAGIITSAIAEDTMVFHRHDPYLKKYNSYRSDYRSDLEYINKRRRRINWEVRNEKQSN